MKYINHEEIYRQTDGGLDIFKHYFPNYNYGNPKAYLSIRDEDKTPSARINFYNGTWRITDFGNTSEINSMKAIPFVMLEENLVFIDALKFIQNVIIKQEIKAGDFIKPKYMADYSFREMEPTDHKGDYNFSFKQEASASDLESIGRYVDNALLKKFHCKPVQSYEYCGPSDKLKRDVVHIFTATKDYPIFLFDYGAFKKLYKPHELVKKYRFVYTGKKSPDYIYGLEQIEAADNEFVDEDSGDILTPEYKPEAHVRDIFRCSGESDALNVASLGNHVYWLNSESANFDQEEFYKIDRLCENHYQILDNDFTGNANAVKLGLKHINMFTLEVPDWVKKKSDWRGNPCKDIKDWINIVGKDLSATANSFLVLKRRAKPMKFWTKSTDKKSGKVSYSINLEYYYWFLQANGFFVMDSQYHRRADYCYARVHGKVIDLIHPNDIKKLTKRFTKEWVKSKNLLDEISILNKINSSAQISESNLQELPEINPNFFHHNKNEEYLHFKNGSLKITPDSIKRIKHEELNAYIMGKLDISDTKITHLIPRNITVQKPPIEVDPTPEYRKLLDELKAAKTMEQRSGVNLRIAKFPEIDRYELTINDPDFIFTLFLKDVSHIYWREEIEQGIKLTADQIKEQNLLLANLLFSLGFQMAQYKDPGRPWIGFIQDLKISQVGQSSGRSGKSLISAFVPYVRPSFYIGGRRKDITEKTEFIYDGFTRFHNNLEVDDLYEFADFNFFYTQASGKREVNSKFISKQILSYGESGKMWISSNFELMNVDSSTLARLLNSAVSDYYHESTKYNDYRETRSPLTKFGRRLYDDFTEPEWNKMYNLAAYCIQMYQRYFKIQPPMNNLEKRQLRREMTKGLGRSEEFWFWANTYFMEAPPNFDKNKVVPMDADAGYYNCYVVKEWASNHFTNTLAKKDQTKYSTGQFKKALTAFANYYGFELNPEVLCNGEANKAARRITRNVDGKTKEVIYISTEPVSSENLEEIDPSALSPEEENNVPF